LKRLVCELETLEKARKLRIEIEGKPLLITYFEGAAYAMSDICPHMGGKLSDGVFEDGKIVCPVHHASFDVKTGEVNERAKILFMKLPTAKAKVLPATIEGQKVYVDL